MSPSTGQFAGTNPRLENFRVRISNRERAFRASTTMGGGGKLWTHEEERELLKLRKAGVSANRMAVRLRRTKRAVEVRLATLRTRDSGLDDSKPH
jgi:hypothetical protein